MTRRRRKYEPAPTQRELDHDERARQAAKRAGERERAVGIHDDDAAARWLARFDRPKRPPA